MSPLIPLSLSLTLGLTTGCDVGSVIEGTAIDSDVVAGENMTISFATTNPQGRWEPTNAIAVWVERNGTFIETIKLRAKTRLLHLVGWNGVTNVGATPDVVSAASRSNHANEVSATWRVPADAIDAMYTIRIEMADENTVDNGAENSLASFTFEKDGMPSDQTGLTDGNFTNVSIKYSGK